MESESRRLQVDVSKLNLEDSLREALRLLAAPEGGMPTYLREAGRVVTELFDELELDAADDATLTALAHRVLEVIAGLTIAGSRATDIAADAEGVDRLEILAAIEARVKEDLQD